MTRTASLLSGAANVTSTGCPTLSEGQLPVLTLPSLSVPSPLRAFSQDTARRNAARASAVAAQRRSERDDVERFLVDLRTAQHRPAR